MRAFDGSVKIDLTLRDVAGRALVIVKLRASRVIHSGGEIHVVVAGAAGRARRIGQIRRGFGSARRLRMAGFATSRISGIGWIDYFREVGPIYDKWSSGNYARQARAHMHLVDHDLQIERASSGRIHVLLGVTEHAHFYAAAPPAMPRQLIVTGVATRCFDDVVNLGYGCAIRHKVEFSAGVIGTQVVSGQDSRRVDANGVGGGYVESGWSPGVE